MVEQNIGTLDQCTSALASDTIESMVSDDISFSEAYLSGTFGTEEVDSGRRRVPRALFEWTPSEKVPTSDDDSLIEANQPIWLAITKDYLMQLSQLTEDWDSYGSPALSPELLKNAVVFLDSIEFENIPSPFVAPVPGGGIQLEWLNEDRELEVEFTGQSVIGYLKITKDESVEEGEILLNNRASARELIRWLKFDK